MVAWKLGQARHGWSADLEIRISWSLAFVAFNALRLSISSVRQLKNHGGRVVVQRRGRSLYLCLYLCLYLYLYLCFYVYLNLGRPLLGGPRVLAPCADASPAADWNENLADCTRAVRAMCIMNEMGLNSEAW